MTISGGIKGSKTYTSLEEVKPFLKSKDPKQVTQELGTKTLQEISNIEKIVSSKLTQLTSKEGKSKASKIFNETLGKRAQANEVRKYQNLQELVRRAKLDRLEAASKSMYRHADKMTLDDLESVPVLKAYVDRKRNQKVDIDALFNDPEKKDGKERFLQGCLSAAKLQVQSDATQEGEFLTFCQTQLDKWSAVDQQISNFYDKAKDQLLKNLTQESWDELSHIAIFVEGVKGASEQQRFNLANAKPEELKEQIEKGFNYARDQFVAGRSLDKRAEFDDFCRPLVTQFLEEAGINAPPAPDAYNEPSLFDQGAPRKLAQFDRNERGQQDLDKPRLLQDFSSETPLPPDDPREAQETKDSFGKSIVAEVTGSINAVRDPQKIMVRKQVDLKGGVEGGVQFHLQGSAALRKGFSRAGKKAMGEDAHILDTATVTYQNKSLHVPFMVTFDGANGHQLAQYGQKHLKRAFQEHLQSLVNEFGCFNSALVGEAMQRARSQLFGKEPEGEAMKVLRAEREAMAQELEYMISDADIAESPGLTEAEIRKKKLETDSRVNMNSTDEQKAHQFGLMFGQMGIKQKMIPILLKEQGMDVASANKKLDDDFKNLALGPGDTVSFLTPIDCYKTGMHFNVKIGDRTYNLGVQEEADTVQGYFEKAIGSARTKTQMVMNAFHVDENEQIVCTTFNDGDCLAFSSEAVDDNQQITALNRVAEGGISKSTKVLHYGDSVTSCSDGHHDKTNLFDLQQFEQRKDIKGLTRQKYVQRVLQASAQVGVGDDITVVSCQVQKGWPSRGRAAAAGQLLGKAPESPKVAAKRAPKRPLPPPPSKTE